MIKRRKKKRTHWHLTLSVSWSTAAALVACDSSDVCCHLLSGTEETSGIVCANSAAVWWRGKKDNNSKCQWRNAAARPWFYVGQIKKCMQIVFTVVRVTTTMRQEFVRQMRIRVWNEQEPAGTWCQTLSPFFLIKIRIETLCFRD